MRKLPKGLFVFVSSDTKSIVVTTIDYWIADYKVPVYISIPIDDSTIQELHNRAITKFYETYGENATRENITPID